MDDLLSFLPFLIIYLIAASSSGRKKKKRNTRRSGPMRTAVEGERMDRRSLQRDRHTAQGFDDAFEPENAHAQACGTQPLHLHDVSADQMEAAGEGEDPCHAGGRLRTPEEQPADETAQPEEDLRRDVLRGVVMSEILIRPQERQALRAIRKGYHGSGNQSHHC